MQIFADATGKEIVRCNGKEHGARGAAMNCGVALGIYSDHKDAIRRVVKENKRFFPNQTNHEKYKKLFELYRSGYQMNMEWWDIRSDFLKK
jgi:sugar (pentulose or hexulose) kinase